MNQNEFDIRQAAADAIGGVPVKDIKIIDGVPEYRPESVSIKAIVGEDESKPLALRADADVI